MLPVFPARDMTARQSQPTRPAEGVQYTCAGREAGGAGVFSVSTYFSRHRVTLGSDTIQSHGQSTPQCPCAEDPVNLAGTRVGGGRELGRLGGPGGRVGAELGMSWQPSRL